MFELIALIILCLSILGIAAMLYSKAPALAALPKNGSTGIKKHRLIKDIETKIRDAHFALFVKQALLHKVLSWIKVMTLKVETKIDTLLHRIRKKAQEIDKQAAKNSPK